METRISLCAHLSMGGRRLYTQTHVAIQIQSLLLKSVAKCRLYDLQEFFFFFQCLLVCLRSTCLHPNPDLPAFTLCPQHMHRHACPNDPARSRQTADVPTPPTSPCPHLPPSLPAQCLILELAAMLTLLASG